MEIDNSTEQVTAGGEQSGVVDSTQSPNEGQESVVDSRDDADFETVEVGEDEAHGGDSSRGDAADAQEPDGAGQADEHAQTREQNAAMRAMRLRAQHDAEAAARAKADATIAGMTGLRNPYTKKPFSSMRSLSTTTRA